MQQVTLDQLVGLELTTEVVSSTLGDEKKAIRISNIIGANCRMVSQFEVVQNDEYIVCSTTDINKAITAYNKM